MQYFSVTVCNICVFVYSFCLKGFECCTVDSSSEACTVRVCVVVCVLGCVCTSPQKTQYGRVSSAENAPLSGNCILLPRTLCLTLAFSLEFYVKPLSPHTNTSHKSHTHTCARTRIHTPSHRYTLVEQKIKE